MNYAVEEQAVGNSTAGGKPNSVNNTADVSEKR